jgi:hypothetical protein
VDRCIYREWDDVFLQAANFPTVRFAIPEISDAIDPSSHVCVQRADVRCAGQCFFLMAPFCALVRMPLTHLFGAVLISHNDSG